MNKEESEVSNISHSKQIMKGAVVLGIVTSVLGGFFEFVVTATAWLMPVVAFALGMFVVKGSRDVSISKKFRKVFKGSLVFVLSFISVSAIVNIIFISIGPGWGLSGLNLLTFAGVVSIVIGLLVGFLVQLFIFTIFGFIGSLFVKE